MRQIHVADVGDGLCIAIHTIFGKTIQIDCGSHDGSNVALNGFDRIYRLLFSPDVLCLSHFHADHYNGLLQASTLKDHPRLQIKEVYYPKSPEFSERSLQRQSSREAGNCVPRCGTMGEQLDRHRIWVLP